MPEKTTKEEFLERLEKEVGDKIKYLKGYKSMRRDKVKVKCLVCGHKWEVYPYFLLAKEKNRRGCPECGKKKVGHGDHSRTAGVVKLRNYHLYFLLTVYLCDPCIIYHL